MKKNLQHSEEARGRVQARVMAEEMELVKGGCSLASLEASQGGVWDVTSGSSDCDDPANKDV